MIKNYGKNEIILTSNSGNTIKLIFAKEDNPKAVNSVLDNLLTTYEKRVYIEKE